MNQSVVELHDALQACEGLNNTAVVLLGIAAVLLGFTVLADMFIRALDKIEEE